jgi:hypothetical protein
MALITFKMHMPAQASPAGEGAQLREAGDSVNAELPFRQSAGPRPVDMDALARVVHASDRQLDALTSG